MSHSPNARWLRGAAVLALASLTLVGQVDPGGALSVGREAHATISVLMTLPELVERTGAAVVAQPVERISRWEEVGGSKRIVTYTRLVLEQTVIGDLKSVASAKVKKSDVSEVWVRTLGGKVDGIGQQVAGEVQFSIGETSLVFLARAADGAVVVVGMAQGHFPLIASADDRVLASSPDTGTLIPRKKTDPPRTARDELLGEKLSVARDRIVKVKKAAQ
jgi:hypothetical protein